jgi:ABC transport system ATP-binding/permease protein
MVKFEKLNPNIPLQSPVSIPFYGEGIVARWGYEALAVEQFTNNRYERLFYDYEKGRSKASFIKQYWKDAMNDKLGVLESSILNQRKYDGFVEDLDFVQYEIKKRLADIPDGTYTDADKLTPGQVNDQVIQSTKAYVEKTRKDNVNEYNKLDNLRNNLITAAESKDKAAFTKLKNEYFNAKLEEFATNRTETDKSVIFKNRLYQKMDPIYMDPQNKFIKAHFYSPKKMVFGIPVNTFIVNVFVIWIMTGLLYLALYFRLLKKLLDFGELLGGNKGSD